MLQKFLKGFFKISVRKLPTVETMSTQNFVHKFLNIGNF